MSELHLGNNTSVRYSFPCPGCKRLITGIFTTKDAAKQNGNLDITGYCKNKDCEKVFYGTALFRSFLAMLDVEVTFDRVDESTVKLEAV
jgi:hypothetical protein